MVKIVLHGVEGRSEHEVPEGSNLVVLAGIKKLPGLQYSCGMGRCTRCASKVLAGGENLPAPNWKEERMLGQDKLGEGYRLLCQLNVTHDLEIQQERLPLKPAWKRQQQPI